MSCSGPVSASTWATSSWTATTHTGLQGGQSTATGLAELVEDQGSLSPASPAQGLEGPTPADCLYHTHSGESYQPSTTASTPLTRAKAVVLKWAQFTQSLEGQDALEVVHCQQTFFPLSGLYRRSRTAVLDFIEEDFDAIFDLHRDAAPWEEYYREIGDRELTQVMLVVGTQNPNYRVNEEFAWQLKAAADAMYPELVKGIFYARGDYNQDLHPRALLMEVGAHTNSRLHAETGAGSLPKWSRHLMAVPRPRRIATDAEIRRIPGSNPLPTRLRPGGSLLRGADPVGSVGGGRLFTSSSVRQLGGVKEKLVGLGQ